MIKRNLNIIIIGLTLIIFVLSVPIYHLWAQKKVIPAFAPGLVQADNNTEDVFQFMDNKYLYASDTQPIVDIYITVLKPEDSDRNITFDYLNNGVLSRDLVVPGMKVIFQEGDQSGPQPGCLGYGERNSNAVLELRGSSTRQTPLKSYKIRFQSNKILWHNMRIVNLNKHPYDITRVRNKLSYDYFKIIPNMMSMRTQFVRLHIKDLSTPNPSNEFKYYGLYTNIEQPNKKFLTAHGLNENGVLYKAESFEFYRSANVLKNVNDPGYNKSAFEKIISVRVGDNHKKLLQMLDDVNDYSQNINDVVDKHFDRDNYLTWLATNILMGNFDTNSQNFMLYSPPNSGKFYFIPWDYDGAWGFTSQNGKPKKYIASWECGLANYWGVVLHHRFFQDPENVKDLCKKVDELALIINKENTKKLLDSYYGVVAPELKKAPDLQGLPGTFEDFKSEYNRLPDLPEQNRQQFYRDLQKPMPIFLGDLNQEAGNLVLNWDSSFDLQGDDLYYDIKIASDPNFTRLLLSSTVTGNKFVFNKLPAGEYYWKVTIRDSKGNNQIPFDKYIDKSNEIHFGVKSFIVP